MKFSRNICIYQIKAIFHPSFPHLNKLPFTVEVIPALFKLELASERLNRTFVIVLKSYCSEHAAYILKYAKE